MKTINVMAIILSTATLAACGAAPGDAELHQALKQATTMGGANGESIFKELIANTKVLDCEKESSGKAYRCNVIGLFGTAQTVRMVKADGGWVILN